VLRAVRFDLIHRSLHRAKVGAAIRGYPNINTSFIAFRKAEHTTPAALRKIARRGR
jgi:hypothetical protein